MTRTNSDAPSAAPNRRRGRFCGAFRHSIKARLIFMLVAFATFMSSVMLIFSLVLINNSELQSLQQNAEYNLSLIANLISNDLTQLTALVNSSAQDKNLTENLARLTSLAAEQADSGSTGSAAMAACKLNIYNLLYDNYLSSPVHLYVRRLIAGDGQGQLIQLSHTVSRSEPLTSYNEASLFTDIDRQTDGWQGIVTDPLSPGDQAIPYLTSISQDDTTLGYMLLLVNTDLFTDRLEGYQPAVDGDLYLQLNQSSYVYQNGRFVQTALPALVTASRPDSSAGEEYRTVRAAQPGADSYWVNYTIRSDFVITQQVRQRSLWRSNNIWISFLLLIISMIFGLAAIIATYLTHSISRPILRLRQRMRELASGDFTVDRRLEWPSEIGDIGQSINQTAVEIQKLMDKRLDDEKQKQNLKYQMLQNQINPHFLYNSLNSIKWMATLQNASGIAEMVTALSRLLRTVSKDTREFLPLKDELAFIQDYFVVQSYRYGGTIDFKTHCDDPALLDLLIPRFSLQPLIENAIFHGLEPKGGGQIELSIQAEAADLIINVTDNGVGMDPQKIHQVLSDEAAYHGGMFRHFGISSVNQRFKYEFGPGYGLKISSQPLVYTRMSLRLPRQTARPDGAVSPSPRGPGKPPQTNADAKQGGS
ncbi:MAG: sensor histidine kinase [Oscillospiraceae bacterium]|nr:sensor histidine kinase [Oscillospiraceae bacterium]MDD4368679.1 sensor histidine kinase [Oscillospiraceae bacterium]